MWAKEDVGERKLGRRDQTDEETRMALSRIDSVESRSSSATVKDIVVRMRRQRLAFPERLALVDGTERARRDARRRSDGPLVPGQRRPLAVVGVVVRVRAQARLKVGEPVVVPRRRVADFDVVVVPPEILVGLQPRQKAAFDDVEDESGDCGLRARPGQRGLARAVVKEVRDFGRREGQDDLRRLPPTRSTA